MKASVEIMVFDGGLNERADPQAVPLNQALVLQNLVFDDYGALTLGNRFKTLNSTPITAAAGFDGLFSFKPATMSALLLSIIKGSVYVITGAGTAPTLIASSQSLFTAGIPCESLVFQEMAFFSNGGQQPYKFNGNEFTRAGISAPSQVLTAISSESAGNLTGTYQYVFWGVNSYSAEGDYGSASTAVTVTSAKNRINNIPTAPVSHGINTWKVGRNTAGQSGVFWYLTDVTNGTTSFTDNVADASLTEEAPTDQGYLRKFNFLIHYGGRMWGAVDDYLWFSNPNQPEEFPSENFFRIGRGDGMNISALAPFKGQIVISKADYSGKTALYRLLIGDSVTFNDPENWIPQLIANEGGSESHRACIPYADSLMLYNRNGAYAYDGSGLSFVGTSTDRGTMVSRRISENVILSESLGKKGARWAAAVNFRNRVWISYDASASATYGNSATRIFDYTISGDRSRIGGAWAVNILAPIANQYAIHEDKLYLGHPNSSTGGTREAGAIYEIGNSSGGVATQIAYFSPMIKGQKGHEDSHKDFRTAFLTLKGSGTIRFYVAVDLIDPESQSASLVELETLTLVSTGFTHRVNIPAVYHGRWLTVAFSSASDTPPTSFVLSKIKIVYSLRGLRNG
jgi:hypothetical protein